MPVVEMPNGDLVEFPDNMPPGEIRRLIESKFPDAAAQAPQTSNLGDRDFLGRAPAPAVPAPASAPASDPSFFEAFARGASTRFLDNLAALPEMLGDFAVQIGAPRPGGISPREAIASGIDFLTGGRVDPMEAGQRARQQIAAGQPALIDMPSAQQITAGTQTALQIPGLLAEDQPLNIGERFEQNLQQQRELDRRFAEQAPIATGAGEIAGDIGTLLTARAPISSQLRAATTATAPAATAAMRQLPALERRLARGLQVAARAIPRGTARAAETGAEAALLAALQDGDPGQAAALAAGAQVGTGPLRFGGKAVANLIRQNKVASAVLAATVLSVGLERLTPGGDPGFFLENFEDLSKEAVTFGLLGLAGAGLGRLGPETLRPGIAEIVELIPRGMLNSAIAAASQDRERVEPVLRQFAQDPNALGPRARDAIAETLEQGGDLLATLDDLQETDARFRRTFEAISQGRPVPAADLIRDAVQADAQRVELKSANSIAEKAAARLGRERAKGFGFGGDSLGPRKFIGRVMEGGGGSLLQERLGRSFEDVLALDLAGRLTEATVRRGDFRALDGNRLERAWSRLPKSARALYPDHVEAAVLALADRARRERIGGGVPDLTARALLQPDGQLRGFLIGDTGADSRSANTGGRRGLLED
ncbi:MAG: hypothetical protein Kow0032_28760 [Methyloligellaceae bacterium]